MKNFFGRVYRLILQAQTVLITHSTIVMSAVLFRTGVVNSSKPEFAIACCAAGVIALLTSFSEQVLAQDNNSHRNILRTITAIWEVQDKAIFDAACRRDSQREAANRRKNVDTRQARSEKLAMEQSALAERGNDTGREDFIPRCLVLANRYSAIQFEYDATLTTIEHRLADTLWGIDERFYRRLAEINRETANIPPAKHRRLFVASYA